jgi:hypothetical protein
MEKQLKAEREKRAAILHAEGLQQSQILTAEGDKRGAILRAEGEKQSAILRAEGQAEAISTVFRSIHDGNPDPKLLAYQYLQTLPQLAQGEGNTVWMIPSELTGALKMLSSAFGNAGEPAGGDRSPAESVAYLTRAEQHSSNDQGPVVIPGPGFYESETKDALLGPDRGGQSGASGPEGQASGQQ